MELLRAISQLIEAGASLLINFVRLTCSSLAIPTLRLAELVGKAAASTEQSAKEYEKRVKEQESQMK
jgi:hypothetical protein